MARNPRHVACVATAASLLMPGLARAADGYDLIATHLFVTPDVVARSLAAVQTTTLRAEADLTEVRFDTNALTVFEATLGGEPSYFSCDWMLCALDRPGDKFTAELALGAPEGWASLTSETARAYPAYLQGFAAGELTAVHDRGGATELVYASAHATAADLRAIFAETPRMLEFYAARAGVPFPHATYYPDLGTRRAIQYSKGALFFVELRRVLGDDAFWAGLRSYTAAHAGGTVESADLQRAFEAAGGRDLAALFAEWVYDEAG